MAPLNKDELAAFVAASCVRSGVPERVTDPGAIRRVAVLLTGRDTEPHAQRADGNRPVSEPPHEIDTGRVKRAAATLGRGDDGVIEQRAHDRVLSGEVEVSPLGAERDTVADDAT